MYACTYDYVFVQINNTGTFTSRCISTSTDTYIENHEFSQSTPIPVWHHRIQVQSPCRLSHQVDSLLTLLGLWHPMPGHSSPPPPPPPGPLCPCAGTFLFSLWLSASFAAAYAAAHLSRLSLLAFVVNCSGRKARMRGGRKQKWSSYFVMDIFFYFQAKGFTYLLLN